MILFVSPQERLLSLATGVDCQRKARIASKVSAQRVERVCLPLAGVQLPCVTISPGHWWLGGCSRVCVAVHRLLVLLLTVGLNASPVSNRLSASPITWHGGLPALTEKKGEGL